MNTTFLELESMPPNEKFNVRSVKRILSTSKFNRKAMEARFPKHGNRRRQINKMFDSIYKSLTLTVVLLSLNLLSIWSIRKIGHPVLMKKINKIKKAWILTFGKKRSNSRLKRSLNDSTSENGRFQIMRCSPLFRAFFFVVNCTLREDLMQKYTPSKIKCIVEHAVL